MLFLYKQAKKQHCIIKYIHFDCIWMANVHLKEDVNFTYIFLFFFYALTAGSRATELITPYNAYEFAVEGDSVTLSCSYTASVRSLHWYRQYAASPPQFLILDSYGSVTKAVPPVAGISIHPRKDNSSVDLKISSVAVTHSAVYYCALEPTVKGNILHAVQKLLKWEKESERWG